MTSEASVPLETIIEGDEPQRKGLQEEGLPVELPRRRMMAVLVVLTALVSAAGAAVVYSWSQLGHDWLWGFVPKFCMDEENNIPTWYSTLLLAACAAALAAAAAAHSRQNEKQLARFFAALSGIFVFLSADEAASLHEMLHSVMKHTVATAVFPVFPWLAAGVVFALATAIWAMRPLLRLPAQTRWGILLAGAVYCAGALGMEAAAGVYIRSAANPALARTSGDFVYGMMSVVEETLEMAGAILLLNAVLRHLERIPGGLWLRVPGRGTAGGLRA